MEWGELVSLVVRRGEGDTFYFTYMLLHYYIAIFYMISSSSSY
jgi:hypothetical protein